MRRDGVAPGCLGRSARPRVRRSSSRFAVGRSPARAGYRAPRCPRARSATATRSGSAPPWRGGTWCSVEAPEPRLARAADPRAPRAATASSAAEAVGKHHLLRFESGRVLHSHLMMSGVWRLLPASPRARGAAASSSRSGTDHPRGGPPPLPAACGFWSPGEPLPRGLLATGPDLLGTAVDPGVRATARAPRPPGADPPGRRGARWTSGSWPGSATSTRARPASSAGIDPWRPVGTPEPGGGARPRRARRPAARRGRARGGAIRTWRPPTRRPGAASAPGSTGAGAGRAGAAAPRALARPGGRQPHHLLVPRLPDLSAGLLGLRGGHSARGGASDTTCSFTSAPISSDDAGEEEEDQVDRGTGQRAVDRSCTSPKFSM